MEMDEKFYWFWLCNIPGIGNQRIHKLLGIFGNPRNIYNASDKLILETGILKEKDVVSARCIKNDSKIFTEYLSIKKKNIKMVTLNDDEYPKRLKNIYNSPVCIYIKGQLPKEESLSVAVVGARNCSEYGRQMAFAIGRVLARAGVNVISGMARGIDGYVHRGAIDGGGYTMGVLAGGVDICYPRENIEIYEHLERCGGIISEYPPGTEPVAGHFPLRNRIISGLSDVVVVVEAREKSGSLITVDMALEQNKLVAAVPGRITDKLSDGCNNLIKLGASIITTPRDILEILHYETHFEKEEFQQKNTKPLATEEKMLYSCLDLTPKNLNTIIEETGLSVSVITEVLLGLEFRGLIKECQRGYYVKNNGVF